MFRLSDPSTDSALSFYKELTTLNTDVLTVLECFILFTLASNSNFGCSYAHVTSSTNQNEGPGSGRRLPDPSSTKVGEKF